MAIDIGRIVYTAYIKHLERNDPDKWGTHPIWEETSREHKDACRHAACEVIKYIDQGKDDIDTIE